MYEAFNRQSSTPYNTSNSAIAERPHCRVGQFWTKVEADILYRHYRPIFSHFDVVGLQAIEFGEITQNKSYYAIQGHSRSPISVAIESPYATSY